jgi:predicted negative regulator of RcsB-dependent stress response
MKALIASFLILMAIIIGFAQFRANYEYSTAIGSYWDLSEKASTLKQKSTYLDKYVAGLEDPATRFAPFNATIYQTPNNSFEQNLVAVKSLQSRMHQIQNMDETSFAYQTAIQQITAQEQGEGQEVTDTFEGCWMLGNHSGLWGWHVVIWWLIIGLGLIFLAVFAASDL